MYTFLGRSIQSFSGFHHEIYDVLRQKEEKLHNETTPEAGSLSKGMNCYEVESILKAVLK
ncbi:hypothetical protein BDV29DRAFT_165251 [Aspergillus leporis]|uniref:Uncharacterized protein n=1 Tax=Aspergillus leporis TaxID=41062 RepID=A0A5N5XE84_9EURO|nr:hypothetical protein BDV29DRAFT_165251 [Aspergillus leporis]